MGESRKRKLDRMGFLSDYFTAFTDKIHTDVIVKPGDDGPGIPAHSYFGSEVKCVYMLDSDECKSSAENSITIPDLSYEELMALLQFFYTGILSPANKHTRALYIAADKYDIPYLQQLCRDQLTSSLCLRNVLDILELSSVPSDTILKRIVIKVIVLNMKLIVNSDKYVSFVRKNPDLSLEITKAFLNHVTAASSTEAVIT